VVVDDFDLVRVAFAAFGGDGLAGTAFREE
jgi:hypothetical protein